MKRLLYAGILSALWLSPAFAAPDPDHDADRALSAVSAITPASTDRWLLLDASASNALGYVATSGVRAALGLGTTDAVTFGAVTAAGATGLKVGTENSVRGAITIYSNVNPFAVGINSAATPTGTWTLSLPPGAPGGANYLFNVDADGTGGWTDPATLGGDNLGSATAANVVTLFNSGTCSGYLKSDGTCDTPTGGYTNLTSFVAQTNWRLFYSNGSGDVTELALGADGEYLKSNGASAAPSWATPSGAAHDAVTLSTDLGNNLLGLSTQQITLDSQTANYIFAAPNSSAGVPSFRAMVDGDIPSAIARDSEIPTAATTSAAGLAPQAVAPAAGRRSVVAIDNAETGYKVAELFDATSPTAEASGSTASVGTAMTAARRDHRHAMPTIPNMAAPGAIGGTTPNTAAFTTLTAGTGTFSVDASGNVTATSLGTTRLAAEGGKTELYEGTNNGNNKVTIQASAALTADKNIVAENIVEVGGAIGAATATTPSADDNDTSVATTAYVQTEITATASDTQTLTNKTFNTASTGNDVTVPLNGDLDGAITDPADADDMIYKKVQNAMTLTDIHCLAEGGGTITLTLQECTTAGASCANIEGAITCDSDGAEDDGTLTDSAIAAGAWIKVLYSAPSGTVNNVAWTVYGTQTW